MTRLHPDTADDIRLSAILSRNQYTRDPAPVIAELRTAAADRADLLPAVVGGWIGYYDSADTRPLVDALRAEVDPAELQPWEDVARGRRSMGHTTP